MSETGGEGAPLLGYCLAANIADETDHGDGGLELRRGLRHFAAGAKVWVLPVQWGDGGEKVIVVGHHRGTQGRGLARIVVARRHLTNFRVRGIYGPALMRALTQPGKDFERGPVLWATREEADRCASRWNEQPVQARADDWSFSYLPVTDPPPLELEHRGQAYHLAHFNARRAVYSRQPPPPEPPSTDGSRS